MSELFNPPALARSRGYSHAAAGRGRTVALAGQIGWDAKQAIVSEDFVAQFDRALANVVAVVTAAGGSPEQIARLAIYVTNKTEYVDRREEVGKAYRAHLGKHFPAMVLVEVKSLLDDKAKVEIEAVAVLSKAS